MSVNLRMPSKSMKSAYNHSSNIHMNCENSVMKNLKGEAENLCLVLPALEVVQNIFFVLHFLLRKKNAFKIIICFEYDLMPQNSLLLIKNIEP